MVQQQANAGSGGSGATVLVVEDDLSLLATVEENLRAQGYLVETAVTGAQALERAGLARPDAVILDLGLPDMDGLEVIAGLRGWSGASVIVLSARAAQQQKIDALDAGAGDYVTKPFGMGELLARLRATLRDRAGAADPTATPIVRTADFTIDLAARRVSREGKDVALTRTQWQIVELFARHPGRLITRRQLLADVWGIGEDDGENNYVRVFMTRIRRKLEPDPANPRYFVTEPGSGLRFLPDGGGESREESRDENGDAGGTVAAD
jgi:two-component system, OmpR family, KDP operon response regulator KdpE